MGRRHGLTSDAGVIWTGWCGVRWGRLDGPQQQDVRQRSGEPHVTICPRRTFDPEEADFFYVPHYVTCYFW